MKRVVIQYKLKPEHAERNIELLHAVYDELDRTQPDGLGHAVLQLADGVTFAQVVETIRSLQITELESIEAADLFRGGQVPPGKFSLMIRVKFQSAEATFADAQLNDFSTRIVAALQEKLGATLRAI